VAAQRYPADPFFNNSLGLLNRDLGQHELALLHQLKAVQALESTKTLQNLAGCYIRLGRFDEAKSTLENVVSKAVDTTGTYSMLYRIALLEGDTQAMKRYSETIAQRSNRTAMSDLRRNEAYNEGRLQDGRQMLKERLATLQFENPANFLGYLSWWEGVVGNHEQATDFARRALRIDQENIGAAFGLAVSGELEEAERIATNLSEKHPKATLVQGRVLPTIRANIELWRGNPGAAIEILEPAKQLEITVASCILTRGRAYIALGNGEEAEKEFEKILENPGITRFWIEYPLAHLGLGRAKVLMNDIFAARKHYQDFFALWKDADPDIPVLIEAKAEYEKLRE
jgi:tetratricopeptide (TPR) repeat protein